MLGFVCLVRGTFVVRMKRATIFVLVLATLMQVWSKPFILVNFWLNQDYIAANLCENKARPQLQCNGKCQLKKQMDNDEKSKDTRIPVQEAVAFFGFASFVIPIAVTSGASKKFFTFNEVVFGKYTVTIFHPPDALG